MLDDTRQRPPPQDALLCPAKIVETVPDLDSQSQTVTETIAAGTQAEADPDGASVSGSTPPQAGDATRVASA